MTAAAVTYRATPRDLPKAAVGVCGLLIAIGLLSFFGGLATDPVKAWGAFHVNFLYFAALSQGGLVLASALVIVGARWAGPVRHVAEGLAAWVPISFVLLIVGAFGREVIGLIPEFLERPNVLGIGEIGLNKNSRNEMTILEEQIALLDSLSPELTELICDRIKRYVQ